MRYNTDGFERRPHAANPSSGPVTPQSRSRKGQHGRMLCCAPEGSSAFARRVCVCCATRLRGGDHVAVSVRSI